MEKSEKKFNLPQENTIELPFCNAFVINEYQNEISFEYLLIIKNSLKAIVENIPCPKAEKFECSIKLSTNEEVHQLNKEYRGKDAPTNVLSFEEDLDDEFAEVFSGDEFTYIGDIIFAMPVVELQAKEQNKTLENHFTHLVVHSILHIFGFDHIDERDREEMEELEIEILKNLGIKDPYIIEED